MISTYKSSAIDDTWPATIQHPIARHDLTDHARSVVLKVDLRSTRLEPTDGHLNGEQLRSWQSGRRARDHTAALGCRHELAESESAQILGAPAEMSATDEDRGAAC